MPIKIIRHDITKIKCDAIVDPTDANYSHRGGVDAAIHEAAGDALYLACMECGRLEIGGAVITSAFALPCKYVIHTAGPDWMGGELGEEKLLRSCYRESLRLAASEKCESVAFPLIASGTLGFPKDRVLRIALDEIGRFLLKNEMLVYVVVFDKSSYSISEKLFLDIEGYIDDHYVERAEDRAHLFKRKEEISGRRYEVAPKIKRDITPYAISECRRIMPLEDLDSKLTSLDESFSQMLLRKIDERGMTDAECYKKANVDRKLFSKIRSDVHYKPSKPTAIAFAIALELSLEETEDMLRKAGFALSHSNKFDIIIEYFISRGIYDIYEINEVLFKFDQITLGV